MSRYPEPPEWSQRSATDPTPDVKPPSFDDLPDAAKIELLLAEARMWKQFMAALMTAMDKDSVMLSYQELHLAKDALIGQATYSDAIRLTLKRSTESD